MELPMFLIASCVVLTVAAGIFILAPLFKGSGGSGLDIELMAETEIDRLMERKAAIYRNLRDLKLEYQMGRLSNEDFRQLEAGYKKDAAVILEKLEALQGPEDTGETLEKEISSGKRSSSKAESAKRVDKCPACGSDIIKGKKFCADCGHKLAAGAR
jgi:hypothetical protein